MADRNHVIQSELSEAVFPVLLMTKRWIRVYADAWALTAVWQKAVKKKSFDDSMLVDSQNRSRTVRTLHIVGSIGPFFGFDIFLNRSMRVTYEFSGGWVAADLGEVGSRALGQWRSFSDATDPDYASDFEKRLLAAPDTVSLIRILSEQYSDHFERTR